MNEILENKLWQTIDQETLDPNNRLTIEDWSEFLSQYEVIFAEECSEIARELFREYLINYKGVRP